MKKILLTLYLIINIECSLPKIWKKSKMPERIYPGKNERLNETTIRDGEHEKRKRLRFKIKVRWHLFDPKPRKPAETRKTDTSRGAEGPLLVE